MSDDLDYEHTKCPLCEDRLPGFGSSKGVVVHLYLHHDLRAPQIHELLMDPERNGYGVPIDLDLDKPTWAEAVLSMHIKHIKEEGG